MNKQPKPSKSVRNLLVAIGLRQPSRHSNATIVIAINNGWIEWKDEPGQRTGYVLTEKGKEVL